MSTKGHIESNKYQKLDELTFAVTVHMYDIKRYPGKASVELLIFDVSEVSFDILNTKSKLISLTFIFTHFMK